MKKFKKIIAAALALCMTGCSMPGSKHTLTIHMNFFGYCVYNNDWPIFKEAEKKTGIALKGTTDNVNSFTAFNTMLSSKKLPDIIHFQADYLNKAGQKGSLIPLNDLIEEHAPHIKEIFDNGLPADFRLIGATTRNPDEIIPAIRSRCVEVFFRGLKPNEIKEIAKEAINKVGLKVSDNGLNIISRFCSNGREVVNLIQLCSGIAINEERNYITEEDIKWVIENGQYTEVEEKKVSKKPMVGVVNGLAVYGANLGILMEIEVTARKIKGRKGELKVSGIVEEEEFSMNNKKIKRKSTAFSSIQNVLTALNNIYNLKCDEYDIHINIPGGIPVDGPSAGIAIATAIYSAILNKPVNNKIAMTGEISLLGMVGVIGGVNAKILAAKSAGANKVIIPSGNWNENFLNYKGIKVIPVSNIKEVFNLSILNIEKSDINILSAKTNKK